MNHNVFLQGWIVGSRLRSHKSYSVAAGTGGGSGEYDKASFLAGLAAGMASRGGLPWMRAIGELPGWVPAGAVIHKIWSVNPPMHSDTFGQYDEIGVIFSVDEGAVIQKSGVCVRSGMFGFVNQAWYYTYAIISETETFKLAQCYYYNGKLLGCSNFSTLPFKVSGNVKYYQSMFTFTEMFYNPYSGIYGPTVFSSEAALGEYMGADIPKY